MKKVLVFLTLTVVFLICLVSCFGQPEHTHKFTEWSVTKNPTCTDDGVKTRYCECGEKQTDSIPFTGHNYIDGECLNCGDLKECKHENLDVLPAKESTCTETGLTEGVKCSDCGDILLSQQEIPLKGHTEETIPAVEPTCTKKGLTEGVKCSECDKTLVAQEEAPLKAHTYDNDDDATCNVCGYERYCVHHNTVTLEGKEPTCTSTGLTEGKQCVDCNEIVVAQTVVPVKKHTEVIDDAVSATCTSTGLTEGKHCLLCETILVEQIVTHVIDHIAGDWIVDVKPTKTEDGSRHTECTMCGMEMNKEKIHATGSLGLEYTLNVDDESYSVTGIGTCTDTELVIPSTYNNLPVTSIGEYAFWNCYSLESLTISNFVTSIGEYAFANCTSLTSIAIGNGVTSIGYDAFLGCSTIRDVYITSIESWCNIDFPNSHSNPAVFSNLYLNNELVINLVIPDGVTSIGDFAFGCLTNMVSVVIPDSVISIGAYSFGACGNMTSVVIPDSVTFIGEGAFTNCINLTNIAVDKNNKYYTSIDGNLYNKDETTLIQYAIGKEDALFEIPNGVEFIRDFAFDYCISLISVVIPDSVTTIGNYAFAACDNLTDVTIGNGVTSIAYDAFYYCSNLASINFVGTIDFWNAIIKDFDWNPYTGSYTIYCTDGEIAKDGTVTYYKAASEGLEFTLNDDGESYSVTGIGTCNDTEISIPSTYNGLPVTSIGDWAFAYCDSLISVAIPDSVIKIEYYAFNHCESLTSIILPDSVLSIESYAFINCYSLTSVVIPKGVTSIGTAPFAGCYNLTSITVDNNPFFKSIDGVLYDFDIKTLIHYPVGKEGSEFIIPNSVTHIGENAFSYSQSLNRIVIPNSVTDIGEYAFRDCDSLSGIIIPNSVVSVGISAFYSCQLLTEINFEGTVQQWNAISLGTSWNDYVPATEVICSDGTVPLKFSEGLTYELNDDGESYSVTGIGNCTDNDIIIPDTYNGLPVTSIVYNAFMCSSLTSIVIPNSVTSIGDYAFSGCFCLTSIVIGDSVTSIGDGAFDCCSSLTSVVIPDSIASIGSTAFGHCTGLTSVVIPDSVTSIGFDVFFGCSSLTSVVIGNGVTSIGHGAFYRCSGLSSVVIPDSVTTIGDWAFELCDSLTTVEFEGTVEQWNAINKGEDWNKYVPATEVICSDGIVPLN